MGLKKAYCRVYQWIYNIGMKVVKWKEPERLEGVDSFHSIPEILEQAGVWAPMIVTGPRIGKTGFLKDLYNDLSERSVIYDQVHPDPTISQIEEMYQIYQDHDCDSIIAIGGGSNMDAAKALAARVARPDKSLQDMKGQLKVGRQVPFFVAVPTTAGTGSETTIAAVVTDDSTYLRREFTDGKELVMFSRNEIRTLPERVFDLFGHMQSTQRMADCGYQAAKEHHTWKSRAAWIREAWM